MIKRVVWGVEISISKATLVEMTIHYVESGMLQMEVEVNICKWVISYLYLLVFSITLYGKLSYCRTIVWCIILCEVISINTKFRIQNMRNSKLNI